MKDSLGDRMKRNYEDRTRLKLPRRTHTIIRLDGKVFHTYTRGRPRPWDPTLHDSMVRAAEALCREAQGALLAYVQSDEISLLLADYARPETEAWFDGNIQKIASVSASVVSAHFNWREQTHKDDLAYFDARVFTIPDPIEVHNYFVWRQKDAIRNSVQAAAQAHFSAKQLHGKKVPDMLAMLESIDKPWADMPAAFKWGTTIYRFLDGHWSTDPGEIFTETKSILTVLSTIRQDKEATSV